jgi:hypothetical protein
MYLTLSTMLLTVVVAVTSLACKPRNYATLSEEESASAAADEDAAQKLLMIRGFAATMGIHTADDKAYAEAWGIAQKYRSRQDDSGYGVWVDAMIFFAEELRKPGLTSIQAGGQAIDFTVLVQEWLRRGNDKSRVCTSNTTCRSAISGLEAMAQVANSMEDQDWHAFGELLAVLGQTIVQLPASSANQLLEYRHASLLGKARFFRMVTFREGYRPTIYSFDHQRNFIESEEVRATVALLDANIADAESMYLRSDDPSRINPMTKYQLLSDYALAELYGTAIDLDTPAEESVKKQPCNNDQSCEQLLANFAPEVRERVQGDVDLIAEEVTMDHAFNRAARYYIERIRANSNDIRPWLQQLEAQAQQWRDWYGSVASQGPAAQRPANITHISPTLALLMLNAFARYEILLPFRHEFRDSMLRLARRSVSYADFGQDQATLTGALKIAEVISVLVDQADRQVRELSQGFDFGDLSRIEKNAAIMIPQDFHSFQAAALEVMIAREKFVDAANTEQERLKNDKHATDLSPSFHVALFNRIASEVEMACVNYAVGLPSSKFYDTGFPQQETNGCWGIYFAGMGLDFERSQGLTGQLAIDKLCGFPSDGRGRVTSHPLTLREIRNRLGKLERDGNMTRVCSQESMKLNIQVASTAISVVMMPVMGGAGSWAMARLAQTAAMRAGQAAASRTFTAIGARALTQQLGAQMAKTAVGRFTTAVVQRTMVVGMESFLSATMFEFGTRLVMAPFGLARFWDPEKGFAANARDYAESIATMTVTFGLLRPVHALAHKVAVPIVGSIPPNIGRVVIPPLARKSVMSGVAHGIPFMATTLYFAEAHRIAHSVQWASDRILGATERDLPHEEESYYQRFMHSAAMTLGFQLFGQMQARWRNQPTEGQVILEQARIWRNQRLAPWSTEFPSLFGVVRMPDGSVKVYAKPEEIGGQLASGSLGPPIDPYKLFGIRMRSPDRRKPSQRDGAEWNAQVNQQYETYVKRMQDAVNKAKEQDAKDVYQKFLDHADMFRKILTTPELRAKLDASLYNPTAYQDFYQKNHAAESGPRLPPRPNPALPGPG